MAEKETPNYYAIIPANVRYDKTLTANAKLLYGEITALCNEKGFCWASNSYFAELYEVTPQAISKWVNSLSDKGYLRLEYEYNGKEIKTRKMYISDVSTKDSKVSTKEEKGINKRLKGYQQKIKENTTVNNTSNNTYNKETQDKPAKRASFQKPSLDDVKSYCLERKNKVDPNKWLSYYESNGWKIGRNPMKDWRAAVRTWESNGYDQKPGYSKPLPVQTRTTFLDMED